MSRKESEIILNNFFKLELKCNKTFVPHEFSSVGENALKHAIATAKNDDVKIHVVHVVINEKLILDAEIELNKILNSIETKLNLIPNVIVGKLYYTISDFAELQKAELIFFGTHGTIGWKHITGNKARANSHFFLR